MLNSNTDSHFRPGCSKQTQNCFDLFLKMEFPEQAHPEKLSRNAPSMGQRYSYRTIWKKNIIEIIHIYGARYSSILICDHQDTESELCEIYISASQPIFTH